MCDFTGSLLLVYKLRINELLNPYNFARRADVPTCKPIVAVLIENNRFMLAIKRQKPYFGVFPFVINVLYLLAFIFLESVSIAAALRAVLNQYPAMLPGSG